MEQWQDPAIVRRYEKQQRSSNPDFDTSSLLSHIPWSIKFVVSNDLSSNVAAAAGVAAAGVAAAGVAAARSTPTTSLEALTAIGTSNQTKVKDVSVQNGDTITDQNHCSKFRTQSYLDIRQEQNLNWARHRLDQGVHWAKLQQQQHQTKPPPSSLQFWQDDHLVDDQTTDDPYFKYYRQAKQCYDDGLQICPDYAPLWVALRALEANVGNLSKAESHLQHALSLDDTTPNAKEYLQAIQQQQQRKVKKSAWVERSETARQNVVLEQAMWREQEQPVVELQQQQQQQQQQLNTTTRQEQGNGDVDEESSRRRSKSVETKKKHRHRRRKSNSDDSDVDDDEYTDDESERRPRRREHRQTRRRRHRDEKKQKQKKRKKRKYYDDDDESSNDSRRHRHRRRRRKDKEGDRHNHRQDHLHQGQCEGSLLSRSRYEGGSVANNNDCEVDQPCVEHHNNSVQPSALGVTSPSYPLSSPKELHDERPDTVYNDYHENHTAK